MIAAASWGAATKVGDAVYVHPIGALISIVTLGLLAMAEKAPEKE